MSLLKNPLIFALDVDTQEEVHLKLAPIIDLIGAVKIGPRLVYRYGSELVQSLAKQVPVFVDNKYFDIPSTMISSVQASFDAGATLVTVHALAGLSVLLELAHLEKKLNEIRPFKILAVTILTSFEDETLPPSMKAMNLQQHVISLTELIAQSGLTGMVCSGQELELIQSQVVGSEKIFKVIPGIRLNQNEGSKVSQEAGIIIQQEVLSQDQKRVMTPRQAIQAGAHALVIGRPILKALNPRKTVMEILESCTQ